MIHLHITPNSQFPTPKKPVIAASNRLGSWRLGVGGYAAATVVLTLSVAISACAQDDRMNTLAEQYVRLVLAVGQHDADYVDAYYGPPAWRTEAEAAKLPPATSRARCHAGAGDCRCNASGDRRRTDTAAASVPCTAAGVSAGAGVDAVGDEASIRRGIEGAL